MEKHKVTQMAEGYKAMADEHEQLVDIASNIEYEVIPEWINKPV